MKGINLLPAIPMRKEPSDRSEMVNQLLYGETFDILEKQEKWSKIKLSHDKYEGWIDNKQWEIANRKNIKQNIISSLFLKKKNSIYPLGSFVDFNVSENKKNASPNCKTIPEYTVFMGWPHLPWNRLFRFYTSGIQNRWHKTDA
jgi:uncharacterized protein YgiM (DUF1202 family)